MSEFIPHLFYIHAVLKIFEYEKGAGFDSPPTFCFAFGKAKRTKTKQWGIIEGGKDKNG